MTDKKWFEMTDDDRYDQLVARLDALGTATPGLPTDALIVLQQSWQQMIDRHRRALLSVIDELTAMMERAEAEQIAHDEAERRLEERQREMEHTL